MCVCVEGGGTERPAGFYCDLHFNFADVFYPICSHPTCVPGVGEEGLHFELQKTLFPECVQTCRDVPPGFLPSPFPPITPPLSLRWGVCLHQLSLSREKVPREDRKCAAFTGLKVAACCCSLVTVIVLKPQQEQSKRSSLFCPNPTIWTAGALFNTF